MLETATRRSRSGSGRRRRARAGRSGRRRPPRRPPGRGRLPTRNRRAGATPQGERKYERCGIDREPDAQTATARSRRSRCDQLHADDEQQHGHDHGVVVPSHALRSSRTFRERSPSAKAMTTGAAAPMDAITTKTMYGADLLAGRDPGLRDRRGSGDGQQEILRVEGGEHDTGPARLDPGVKASERAHPLRRRRLLDAMRAAARHCLRARRISPSPRIRKSASTQFADV